MKKEITFLLLFSLSSFLFAEEIPVPQELKAKSDESGLILMPTAYRNGVGQGVGANLDIVSTYYIGRLYGEHNLGQNSGHDLLSRIGIWIFTFDPKLVLQEEKTFSPALAMGYQVSYLMRDTKAPSSPSSDIELVSLKKSSSQTLLGFYLVASKKIKTLSLHLGYLRGNVGNMLSYLSEYLPASSEAGNVIPSMFYAGTEMDFFSLLNLKFEFIKPYNLNRSPGLGYSPWIINTHLGKFLHLSFDVSFLKYRGGYDWLGFFNFRINVFPWEKGQ